MMDLHQQFGSGGPSRILRFRSKKQLADFKQDATKTAIVGSLPAMPRSLLALTLAFLCASGRADEPADMPISVTKQGEVVVIDAAFDVPASSQIAWQVLTDYEHMPQFMPELETSRILERGNNALRLSQTGHVSIGPISIPFEYLRQIELIPQREIRSHAIGGSLKAGEVTTRIAEQGGKSHVTYHSEVVPAVSLPFGIDAAFAKRSVMRQLTALRNEMMRRKGEGRE